MMIELVIDLTIEDNKILIGLFPEYENLNQRNLSMLVMMIEHYYPFLLLFAIKKQLKIIV